jgi:glutamate racemase
VPDRPIALFDSGFGGLTVARAVIDLLPNEEIVYLGDTGQISLRSAAPGGSTSTSPTRSPPNSLKEQRREDARWWPATRRPPQRSSELQDRFDIPVDRCDRTRCAVGDLGVQRATDGVGVIGTVGTINSGAYQHSR